MYGEYFGDSTQLLYLRARYYNTGLGRFISKDSWIGNATVPISYNQWNYANANPINYIDPSGYFSKGTIETSLNGLSLDEAFGRKKYNVARWGLYALLRDLNSWNQFTLRTADFEYDGSTYPLKPDNDGSWIVYENSSCELIFSNLKWGFQSLPGFLQVLERKAETNSWISGKWWRQASVQYHWYEANNKYYSDFYEFSDMPQLIMTTSAPVLKVVNETYIRDKFGNQYTALAAGFPDISVVQTWEGYASFNSSNRVWGQLSENQLRSIILGWSITITGSIGWDGVGASVWRTGTVGLFGGYYPSAGVSLSVGHTWESPVADYFHAWDWVDDIARYGLPQNDH